MSMNSAVSTVALHRAVRLTARGSATLFAAAAATLALRPVAERTTRRLYVGFLLAHAVHFVAVAKYAIRTKGQSLFPGGRNLDAVGGWPTVAVIYTAFAGVALIGWPAHADSRAGRRLRLAGGTARVLIGTLFVGTYLGQLRLSRWYGVPAAMVGAAVIAEPLVRKVWGRTDSVRLAVPWSPAPAGSASPATQLSRSHPGQHEPRLRGRGIPERLD
jgi:hypothetical protein